MVRAASHEVEAEVAASVLRAHGIPARVANDFPWQGALGWWAVGGFRVLVPEASLREARCILGLTEPEEREQGSLLVRFTLTFLGLLGLTFLATLLVTPR